MQITGSIVPDGISLMIKKTMMKRIITVILGLCSAITFGQVGINTQNPQQVFHIDGAKDNPDTGAPTANQQLNDFVVTSEGSVGIGTTSPLASAVLDMSAITNKGMIAPNVSLTSNTDQITVLAPAIGLIVYNTGAAGLTYAGYVFWSGTEWRSINSSTLISATVSQINCLSAVLTPSTYSAGTAYSGTLTVPYLDGNGGQYVGGTSVVVNGLTFRLKPGILDVGFGNLYFTVSGKPTVSSPTMSNISINSTLVPFYTGVGCTTTNVGFGTESDSGTFVTATYDIDSTTPTSSVTCFDGGRFCVRYNGTTGASPVQIRQTYGATQVALSYSVWGNGASSDASTFKNVSLAQNSWTNIYDFGPNDNTEGSFSIVTMMDKTTLQTRSFQIIASIIFNGESGAVKDKLFFKVLKN